MTFQRGDRIEVFQASRDDAWEAYMDDFLGCRGVIVDPDTSVNDPDAWWRSAWKEKAPTGFPRIACDHWRRENENQGVDQRQCRSFLYGTR